MSQHPRQREGREPTVPAFATKQPDTLTSFSQPTSADPVVQQHDSKEAR